MSQKGSLYQLRNMIGRINVTTPKSRFDECEDFFILVVEAYTLVCGMELFQMTSLQDNATFPGVNDEVWLKSDDERRTMLLGMSSAIVKEFVEFRFHDIPASLSGDDDVKSHSIQVRVFTTWKYMLPMFISTGRKNYAKEALLMLFKYNFAVSPRMSHQMMYSRFVNTHGTIGRNIPCDLHNEHLN